MLILINIILHFVNAFKIPTVSYQFFLCVKYAATQRFVMR